MAEHGEWNRKGATLSDKTAKKEYGEEIGHKGIGKAELDVVVMRKRINAEKEG